MDWAARHGHTTLLSVVLSDLNRVRARCGPTGVGGEERVVVVAISSAVEPASTLAAVLPAAVPARSRKDRAGAR
eukprot:m.1310560 g.1310560  ORF g.1310560 m.1310560 type:complete len:74 (-) comp24826_c0_seq5:893-1114(-)